MGARAEGKSPSQDIQISAQTKISKSRPTIMTLEKKKIETENDSKPNAHKP